MLNMSSGSVVRNNFLGVGENQLVQVIHLPIPNRFCADRRLYHSRHDLESLAREQNRVEEGFLREFEDLQEWARDRAKRMRKE